MKIYCSGIGGIGLSAYAALQTKAGHKVSGSDRTMTPLLEDLQSQGIGISLDQSGASVPADANLFVYSEAIPADAPERVKALGFGIEQQSYPQALGQLASVAKSVIAVCGTHGKSSTTGMATRLLMHSGREPTVVVGTKLKELDGRNWRQGAGDTFLLEACEYRHSFFHYAPNVILMTTCDGDHFDFYKSIEEYRAAFIAFVQKLPANGVLITHMGDPDCRAVAEAAGRTVMDADAYPMIALRTPGEHMQRNAQLVLALAEHLSIPAEQAQAAVSGYAGSWRRLETKGTYGDGVTVIDDYGHHPIEIRETIKALLAAHPGRRMICVFQPHTHERTRTFYEDFIRNFRGVHTVVVPNIYEARKDIETGKVDVDQLVTDIARESSTICINGKSLAETEALLKTSLLKPGDLLLCLGAGDVTQLATRMVTATMKS